MLKCLLPVYLLSNTVRQGDTVRHWCYTASKNTFDNMSVALPSARSHCEASVWLSHLFVSLEDVLCGDGAHSGAQGLDHSICHLRAHAGGIGVQNTEMTLVTLHHQLQGAPLGVHAAGVDCSLLTAPASTCHHKDQSGRSCTFTCHIHANSSSSDHQTGQQGHPLLLLF